MSLTLALGVDRLPSEMPWYVAVEVKANPFITDFPSLDEFDVFMDAVNRRISMKMMVKFFCLFFFTNAHCGPAQIDTANQSDKKQYILITPQDMNNITIGPTVRVHRMTDPERGQGILAMG